MRRGLYLLSWFFLLFSLQCQREYISYEEGLFIPEATKGRLSGEVVDAKTGRPIPGALIAFPAIDTKSLYAVDKSGMFSLSVPARTHTIRITASGYLPNEAQVKVPIEGTVVRFLLQRGRPVEEIKTIERPRPARPSKPIENIRPERRLFSIYFDKRSSLIKPEFHPLLLEIAKILREKPSLRAVIRGHTDSIGDKFYNFELSQREALSVKWHLVRLGANPIRLVTQNYGEWFPRGDNRTISGRQLNRRVDVVFY